MSYWRQNKLDQVLILGLGLSGHGAGRLALQQGLKVEIRDEGTGQKLEESAAQLEKEGARVKIGPESLSPLKFRPDLIITSPGLPSTSKLASFASDLNLPVIGEFEFGAAYCTAPIVCVTGTNGKTTTVEMTVHCLQYAGLNAIAAGNIGLPISEVALRLPQPDFIIAEISSFQLETIKTFTAHAAALLNISDDHLDRYRDFNAYVKAKSRILQTVSRAEAAVLHEQLRRLPQIDAACRKLPGRPAIFRAEPPESAGIDFFTTADGRFFHQKKEELKKIEFLAAAQFKLPGKHNRENALAATALAEKCGIPPEISGKALSEFKMAPHRLQTVAVLSGIKIVNDSKSTNPESLSSALQALATPNIKNIILIAGGLDKKMNFSNVKPWLQETVKHAICIGEARRKLADEWKESCAVTICENFLEAVTNAIASAKYGDILLLSPGCASQDMFRDYKERGEIFMELIYKELKK